MEGIVIIFYGILSLLIWVTIVATPIILTMRLFKHLKKKNATQIIIKTDKKIELIKKAEALQMNLNDYILYVFNKEMPN